MDIKTAQGYSLLNLNGIGILLGKNGSGKSSLLRDVEQDLSSRKGEFGKTKYITPERGGSLVYEAGVEQNLASNVNWLSGQRRKNQEAQFRQQSMAQFRKLKEIVLEEIEQDQSKRSDPNYKFDIYITKLNSLLDQIEIQRKDSTFKIFKKGTTEELNPSIISSGESELISLGIECLIFSKEIEPGKQNLLFLDEPDVHLHPDLQVRLMHFLVELVTEHTFIVLIATHSTAILGALESYNNTQIAFIKNGQKEIVFEPITDIYKKILPVFGAHPLSNLFNEAPVLLVEGEDDERIWQQAVRSSTGKIKIFPCSCDSISKLNDFEKEVQKILNSVYDNAKAFSLRDRDDSPEEGISDLRPVTRMQLSCRNAENLLLTDEVLGSLGTTWEELKKKIEAWLNNNKEHIHFNVMNDFKIGGFNRKQYDIKKIRNDLMGIIGSSKPWEVAVGQVLSEVRWNDTTNFDEEGKIICYLGQKTTRNLLQKT